MPGVDGDQLLNPGLASPSIVRTPQGLEFQGVFEGAIGSWKWPESVYFTRTASYLRLILQFKQHYA